ncbi:hypothetical protein DICPUDRAFT_81083 [Dictyostelium purpureum]|uniref:Prespore-specific protein n=1 Tax=Dictyostelium purpureum TaxID=5786 RepID=F0ZSF3_DICPU|nr:uncharacterized protein DICPUDRAFT_81083 [Dictyostelium purpureum]EGC33110.1 hypothetical protein DICPUDRAFT_81083 [Dictyostelium purpureum]|eukprot:XP_003290347.1 hypothetical protein DICPUDRAFT_81083 [Dictyostelium purpureum]
MTQQPTTTTAPTTVTPTPPPKDKRSNRRRVSCGFHHKRHQACPDNCEGRVTHPPDVHPPVQDKFTVGCTECKNYFQEKLFSQTTLSGKPISQVITSPSNNITTPINKKKKTNTTQPITITPPPQSPQKENLINKSTTSTTTIATTKPIDITATNINNNSNKNKQDSLNAVVPSFNLMTSVIQAAANAISTYEQNPSSTLSPFNQKKRKFSYDNTSGDELEGFSASSSTSTFSPSSSPLSLSRVPSPSQEIISSSPLASPQLAVPSAPSPLSSPKTAAESLLFLLEQEVEKEIITQKENDLSVRKVKQRQEQEYIERIQHVLDYKKNQQDLEYLRLQQKQKELENWSIQLEQFEKELIIKQYQNQQFLSNFNTFTNSSNINNNSLLNEQQKYKIQNYQGQFYQLNNNNNNTNNKSTMAYHNPKS